MITLYFLYLISINDYEFSTIIYLFRHFFGEIVSGKMHLSGTGQIVENEWLKTPQIRPDMDINLGAYMIMPNHFHCIIDINGCFNCRDAMHCVSTGITNCVSTDTTKSNKFGSQSKNY